MNGWYVLIGIAVVIGVMIGLVCLAGFLYEKWEDRRVRLKTEYCNKILQPYAITYDRVAPIPPDPPEKVLKKVHREYRWLSRRSRATGVDLNIADRLAWWVVSGREYVRAPL